MMHNRPHESKRRLYRIPSKAKICGVCAGVAEYFGFEVWVVRIITATMALFGWVPIIIAYFVLYFVLDPKPGFEHNKGYFSRSSKRENQNDEDRPYNPSVKDVWKRSHSPETLLSEIEEKFSQVENKLQNLETFVTSKRFHLEKEFSKMES